MFTNYDYDNQPIVDIVNNMLIDAARKRASDIHFDPTPTVLNVRINFICRGACFCKKEFSYKN